MMMATTSAAGMIVLVLAVLMLLGVAPMTNVIVGVLFLIVGLGLAPFYWYRSATP